MIKEKEVVNFYDLVNLYRGEEEGDGVKQNNGDGNKVDLSRDYGAKKGFTGLSWL